jgi:drug/metabolite transporter (DMT)-like permease
MIGILFSLVPLVGWGIGDYISSKLSKGYHPAVINLSLSLVAGVPLIIIALFFGVPEFSFKSVTLFLGVSVLISAGFISMVKAFSYGATGVVSPIANAYAVVTLLIAVVFLGVETSVIQIISVFTVVGGISLLSYEKSQGKKLKLHNSVVYAILALLFFGLGFAGFDIAATQEWYQNIILFEISMTIIAACIVVFWLKGDSVRQMKKVFKSKNTYYGGLLGATGSLGLFLAIANVENIAVPAAIAAASPLVTVALARRYDKEHLNFHQYVGAVVVVIGIAMLSFSI